MLWKRLIMIGGEAEPPIATRFRLVKRWPWASIQSSRPSQTVGTPTVQVTPSASNRACRLAPSRFGPGMTSLAPAIGPEKGTPQALTWNIGTIGESTSLADRPSTSGIELDIAWSTLERWL
jgi:hypothetical protein